MKGFIAAVDARTQLAGQNRMELLLFCLRGKQRFGINVFKVREVIQCPKLTVLPKSDRVVLGVANIRGKTISVIDLGVAIGMPPIVDTKNAFLVITEYNRHVQGFLVESVDSIVNHNWEQILPPPSGNAAQGYLTAVTHVGEELVGIVDVERVLAELIGVESKISEEARLTRSVANAEKKLIFIVDDSVVARNQIKRTVEQMGGETIVACDGLEAWELLTTWVQVGAEELDRLAMIVSDIEMPNMDGYTLVTKIRENADLKNFRVMLHTSMSGGFNESMIKKVGADAFIAKFNPEELSKELFRIIEKSNATETPELAS